MTASAAAVGARARVRRALPWLLVAAAIAFPWAAGAADYAWLVGVLRRVLIFAIAAASLNFLLGYGGMASLGHAAFFGVGAYTVGVLAHEGIASAWVGWPLAMAVAGLAAGAIGAVSLRTRGVYFIMITLAFAQMVYYVAVGLKRYGGEDGLNLPLRSSVGFGVDLGSDVAFYYVVLALLVAVLAALHRILDARFGRALVGIRENESRMESLGFPTYRLRLAAFVIAGAVAGLAGALFANHNQFVSPSALHWTQSALFVVMVIVGGIGTRYGGLLGALALLLLEELLATYTDIWRLPLGVLLLAVVFLAPRGLAGWLERRTAA
jgi:branched-chain amino acid transport system permease protein